MSELNPKQQLFVKAYRREPNATKAAIDAGYSAKAARVTGHRLLTNANVAHEIGLQQKALQGKLELDVEWVTRRLMMRAGFDVRKFYNQDGTLKTVTELDEETAFALQGVEIEKLYEHFGKGQAQNTGTLTKIKFADRDRALELLGRHLKMFTDKMEVSGLEAMADELAKARARAAG